MNNKNSKIEQRLRRRRKIRSRIFGVAKRPRLAVFRSNKYIYAQLIDDEKNQTLASASDLGEKGKNKTERASEVGVNLGKIAKEKKIETIIFDRGGFNYTGRVKALAEGLRKEGLKF